MRQTATLLTVLFVSTAMIAACGRFKKDKDEEDEPSSDDALAADSEIKWDEEYKLTGKLSDQASMSPRFSYVLEREFSLIATDAVNMRLQSADATTRCPSGSTLRGVYFTLTSADGTYIRTTDTVEQPAPPVDLSAFPGRVPAGTYTLIVRAYADGPCNVDVTFSFPNPNPVGLPADSEKDVDTDLVGSWAGEDESSSIRRTIDLVFASNHTMSWTERRGDLVRTDFTAKYHVDVKSVPRRALITVTQVKIAGSDMQLSAGSTLRCIYSGQPNGAATALYWECNDRDATAFPVDFGDDALAFYRTGSGNGGIWNFEVAKGGVVNIAVPDNDLTGAQSVFDLQTDGTRVADVAIEFTAEHPIPGDLRVTLVHPDGTDIPLFERETTSSDYVTRMYGFTGTRLAALDALKGKTINGKWRLKIADESPGDTGYLAYARLVIRGRY